MTPSAARTQEGRAIKYLAFELGGEEFGIPVSKVRHIMGVQEITRVPHMPPYVKGVLNLRGRVVPVVDLRLRFAMPPIEYTRRTCIVVVDLAGESGPALGAVVVDCVAEVISIPPGDLEDAPAFGPQTDISYLLGLAKVGGKVKILLDLDRVMTAGSLAGLDTART